MGVVRSARDITLPAECTYVYVLCASLLQVSCSLLHESALSPNSHLGRWVGEGWEELRAHRRRPRCWQMP